MSKSSPQAPKAPDPVATANAQTASNIATANATANLNHSNQVTPWGTQTWSQGTPGADGTSQWTSNITLDPAQQKLLDSSNSISQLMADLGISQANRVSDSLATAPDYSKLQQVQNGALTTNVGDAGQFQTSAYGGAIQQAPRNNGQVQGSVGSGGPIQSGIGSGGYIQKGINTDGTENLSRNVNGAPIQSQINMGGVPGMVGGDALYGAMKDSQGAAYNMQKQYLDSDYSQRQHDLENQLTQQGVLQGSDAWNRATQNLGQQRTFDYNNAYNNSFDKGLAANSQLYNQGLSSNQNAYAQAANNGNFANSAQQQGFSQGMQNAQLNNSAAGQLNSQRLAQMMAGNAAQGQQFDQNVTQGNFANAAQGQQFGQNLAQGNFANSAQQQGYGQNMTDAAFNNAAQSQMYGQSANNAQLNNSAVNNRFSQGLANASLNNQASAQGFNQSSALRAQQLQEMLQQQNQPLNMLNALRSGSQVTAPTFGSTPQGNVQGTDIAGLYNQQYQGQLAAYNAQQAGNNALTSGLFQLGGSALMSPLGTFANMFK